MEFFFCRQEINLQDTRETLFFQRFFRIGEYTAYMLNRKEVSR
jgi:hypothetical protein